MERLRSIANLWNWLPAFRAVAETGNLRLAAERLHVSPSALSRTVRLLEDEIEKPLFDRVGRTLQLNAAGEQLLAAVRESMRRVHDAKLLIDTKLLSGRVRMRGPGTMSHAFLVPLVDRLREQHPELIPEIAPALAGGDPYAALQLGDIDIAFATEPIAQPELITIRLGACSSGVYCGPGHPLYGRENVTMEELAEHAFVAPPSDDGVPLEGWPAEIPRKIGAYVNALSLGIEICAQGGLLAVLPDVIARRPPHVGTLFRLPSSGIAPMQFYACHRPALTPGGRVETTLEVLRQVVADALATAEGNDAAG